MIDLYGLPVIYDEAAPEDGYVYVPPIRVTDPFPGLLPKADRLWYDRIGPAASRTGAVVVRDHAALTRLVEAMNGARSMRPFSLWDDPVFPDVWKVRYGVHGPELGPSDA